MMTQTRYPWFAVTPQILVDELENDGYTISLYGHNRTLPLSNIQFITKSICPASNPDSVYFALEKLTEYSIFSLQNCVILLERPPKGLLARGCVVISVLGDPEPIVLFNRISCIFSKFEQWNRKVRYAVEAGDLQGLIELGREVFGNPLFVHDNKFNYLSMQRWIAGQTEPVLNRRTGYGMIPVDVVNSLHQSKSYQKTMCTHGAQIYEDFNIDSYRVLYVNLWEKGIYIARLCIDEMSTPILPSHFIIAEFYADRILETIQKQNAQINHQFTELEKTLASILSSENPHLEDLNHPLSSLQWNWQDQYLVLSIQCRNPESSNGIPALCYAVGHEVSECCIFPFQDGIFGLINLSAEKATPSTIKNILSQAVDLNRYTVGLSKVFYDLSMLPVYHRQASQAIFVGNRENPNIIHDYADTFLLCILLHGTRHMPADSLIPDPVRMLSDYDRENSTELLPSLKEYLRCGGNLTRAAENLFIHRTTMVYRITRVQELTGLEFDYDTKLALGFYFYISDHPAIFLDPEDSAAN